MPQSETYIIRVLSALIVYVLIFVVRWIWISANYVNHEYIKPARKNYKNIQEQYRKYLIQCDRKGKTPLTYKQWKFAYVNKKVKK